ncbi:MAG: phosphoribosyl-ATP diphosphatase [Pseudomonadota bacterium]
MPDSPSDSRVADTLGQVEAVIQARRHADPESSYVASLHGKGLNKILEKVGEEAIEVIIAAKELATLESERTALERDFIGEVADLWFHTLVLLNHQGCSSNDVLAVLKRRLGTSGLAEKAERSDRSIPSG